MRRRRQQRVGHIHARLHDLRRLEIDDAVLAKAIVERAVRRLDGVQPARSSSEDDRRRGAVAARPIGEAALRRHVVVGKLKFPFLHAGGRVQREDGAVGRREIHRVADHDRNGFVFPQRAGIAGRLEMKAPGRLKRGDIGRRDLIERAVAVGALVVVGGRPVGGIRWNLRTGGGA